MIGLNLYMNLQHFHCFSDVFFYLISAIQNQGTLLRDPF